MKKKIAVKDIVFISLIVLLTAALVTVSVLYGISNIKEGTPNENIYGDYYAAKCASYAVQNGNLSSGQIVFIGDSITDLYHLDDYYADLDKAVYNRGIGGDTAPGVYDRLKVSLYDIAPSKIVLLIGINDLNIGRTNDFVYEHYERILTDIKANLPTSEVFCLSILPLHEKLNVSYIDIAARNVQIGQLNSRLNDLVASKGYTYVDLASHLTAEDGQLKSECTDDGIHLNAAGFTVWTSVVKPLIA